MLSDGGVEGDDEYIADILSVASSIKSFNAIILVEKSSNRRIAPNIAYNLYRISEAIPNDFESKVIVMLTFHTGGDSGFQDEWMWFESCM